MSDPLQSDRKRPHVSPAPFRTPYQSITPERAGWEHLSFAAYRLSRGDRWEHATGKDEYLIVILGGTCTVRSGGLVWNDVGKRADVFGGMPYAMFFPRKAEFSITAESAQLDFACGWARALRDHQPRLVTPGSVGIEIRGGGNATRQINAMFPAGRAGDRLIAVEVYTPPGNWSSYPPHKHDAHRLAPDGTILEADLEEVYFYKIDPPNGFALQRIYTADGRRDEALVVGDNDLILVPAGYHPVAAAPGYTVYYLNFLAGSAHSLASADDPAHAWVKTTWTDKDPRLPLVS